ncbi:glycosyltransferase [Flavobacterium wongokense]|uniref:glycosyltransferase n=1 Tax=Flavobacterium wongokense TaxID=2910674 RepID=UPI001F216EB3|nr:glycosyltransferase [Flavobacterium sp. WG47]MCF6132698.1 glycosyltransferase [Flavobacterium sp. WG47]
MAQKKIVIVLPKLTPGGTERTAVVLANYMVEKNIDVTILVMFKRDKFYELHPKVKLMEPDNFRDKYGKILSFPILLWYLRKSIKAEKPDTVFCLGYMLLGIITSVGIKTKVIISGRSSPDRVRFPGNALFNAFYNFCYAVFKFRIDGIIAQTNYAKEVYQKKYSCPIVVIPNFLREIKEFQHQRKNQIITLGRCSYEKAQHFLLEAFAKINAPNWTLAIVGDGPLLDDLKNQAKALNIAEKVEFCGFQKEVDFYLSQAKIFGFTSIIEGYPNALIEGMANGLAPVSFNCVAGPSDIIKENENGFLIPVGNVALFAEKLQLLIDNQDLLDKISSNASKIKQTNDLKIIAGQYQDFLLPSA